MSSTGGKSLQLPIHCTRPTHAPASPPAATNLPCPPYRHIRKHRPELEEEQKQQRSRQAELELEAAEEEAMAARVEAAVQARVAEALASEDVAARIAQRLKEERAKLEERVTRQVGAGGLWDGLGERRGERLAAVKQPLSLGGAVWCGD